MKLGLSEEAHGCLHPPQELAVITVQGYWVFPMCCDYPDPDAVS